MPRNSLWSHYLLLMQNIYWVKSRDLIYRNSAVIAQRLREKPQTAGTSQPCLRDSGVARSRVPPADTSSWPASSQGTEGKAELVWPRWEADGNPGGNARSWGFPPRAASEQASLLVHRWEVGGMEEAVPKRNRKKEGRGIFTNISTLHSQIYFHFEF